MANSLTILSSQPLVYYGVFVFFFSFQFFLLFIMLLSAPAFEERHFLVVIEGIRPCPCTMQVHDDFIERKVDLWKL